MNGRWRALLTAIALPLLFLPLRAAEAPPPTSEERPAPPATPPASPGETPPAAADPPADEGTNERVSVDNNLTFPVDI